MRCAPDGSGGCIACGTGGIGGRIGGGIAGCTACCVGGGGIGGDSAACSACGTDGIAGCIVGGMAGCIARGGTCGGIGGWPIGCKFGMMSICVGGAGCGLAAIYIETGGRAATAGRTAPQR